MIATDGRSMAGDGLSHDVGGLICSTSVAKVRRLKDGRIMGVAGNPFDTDAFEEWLNDGGTFPDRQDCKAEAFDLIVLETDGRVFSYAKHGRRSEQLLPCAIGSGTDMAIGAMSAGASPEAAAKLVCKRQIGCGGKVIVLHLEDGK